MPTTDPVKRRKQNCENQKRWRQRQIDELRKLRTALEKSDLRVKDLETESGKLRGALQNALDEIGHLRRDPSSAHRQSSQRNGFNTDRPHENRNSSTFAVSISHGTQPSVESNQIASAVSCSKVLGVNAAQLPITGTVSGENEEDWKSIVIADDDPDHQQRELSIPFHLHAPGNVSRDVDFDNETRSVPVTLTAVARHAEDHHPDWSEGMTSTAVMTPMSEQIESSRWLEPNLPIADATLQDGADETEEASPQEVPRVTYDPDPTLFNWSPVSMLGGSRGIWQRRLDFPDTTTRISKHICTVQNMLWGVFPQLVARSLIDRERLVAGAFEWMINECWPSTERCFKLMTVYQHIYNFELWRSFPCKATHDRIHPMYRPTALQLAVPHSPAIDWLPWPALRDKAIQAHNQVDVDRLCMMALEHTVIVPRLSGARAPRGSPDSAFRVWDMYLLEKINGSCFSRTSMTHNPTSPNLQALLKAYDLPVQDVTHFRIDAPFYAVFPEMYISSCAARCQATPLEVPYDDRLRHPADLTPASVDRLHKRVQEYLAGAAAEAGWAV